MRAAFAMQSAMLEQRIEFELTKAVLALDQLARAIGDGGYESSEAVSREGERLKRAVRKLDSDLVVTIARQAPVASDLRLVLALLALTQCGCLIANHFVLIGDHLREIDPHVLGCHVVADQLCCMALLTGSQLRQATKAFALRDLGLAERVEFEDDEIDELNRQIVKATLALGDAVQRRTTGFRYVLIARSIERIWDNAVDIAEQAAFLLTAQLHEFSDASRPRSIV